MPYATDSDLLARVSGVSVVSPARRAIALSDAEAWIDAELWEPFTLQAHVALAAHKLASDPLSGYVAPPVGNITSRRIAALAVTYATPDGTASGPNASTRHGQEFDRIFARILHPPIAVGMGDL